MERSPDLKGPQAAAPYTIFSCSTNAGNSNKNIACRIITIRSPLSGTAEYLTYNSDNKLERVINGTTASFYAYQDNSITISQFDSGVFHNKTVVTLNPTGLALSIHTENDPTGASWSNSVNIYDNDEIARTVTPSRAQTRRSLITTPINPGSQGIFCRYYSCCRDSSCIEIETF